MSQGFWILLAIIAVVIIGAWFFFHRSKESEERIISSNDSWRRRDTLPPPPVPNPAVHHGALPASSARRLGEAAQRAPSTPIPLKEVQVEPTRRPVKTGDLVRLHDNSGLSAATVSKLRGRTFKAKVTKGSSGKKLVTLCDPKTGKPVAGTRYQLKNFRPA